MLKHITNLDEKIELIRRYRADGGAAEYVQPMVKPSFVQLHLSQGEYLISNKPSEISVILSNFPVSSVRELFQASHS